MARRALSNNRRLYFCAYDVADDKRRTKLFELLKDHGEHVQFSVFLCELTKSEVAGLIARSRRILHETDDQFLTIDVGKPVASWQDRLQVVGKSWQPQVRAHII